LLCIAKHDQVAAHPAIAQGFQRRAGCHDKALAFVHFILVSGPAYHAVEGGNCGACRVELCTRQAPASFERIVRLPFARFRAVLASSTLAYKARM